MKTTASLKPGKKLWRICHTDREHAAKLDDPLRTVVEAPNKLIAEETAARLDFGDPWAHSVTSNQVMRAQWIRKRRPGHRQNPNPLLALESLFYQLPEGPQMERTRKALQYCRERQARKPRENEPRRPGDMTS